MSKRAESAAQKAYPKEDGKVWHSAFGAFEFDKNAGARKAYQEGYEQAEKDLAPAFEFPFEVPDNDGYLVFTAMDNRTIRKALKLKKGEGIIVSIRKDK